MHAPPRPGRAVALAGAIVAAACGGDDTTAPPATTAAPPTSSTTAAGDVGSTATTAITEPAAGTVVEVTVTGGEVDGPGRVDVPLGDVVTVRVTSDVADHVHVHGYDLLGDVAAGGTAEVTFTADLPGVYEVELEDAGLVLVELAVG